MLVDVAVVAALAELRHDVQDEPLRIAGASLTRGVHHRRIGMSRRASVTSARRGRHGNSAAEPVTGIKRKMWRRREPSVQGKLRQIAAFRRDSLRFAASRRR